MALFGQQSGNMLRRFRAFHRMAARHDSHPRALVKARQQAAKRAVGGLTPRIRTAIEALVFGIDGVPTSEVNQTRAALHAGLSPRALRAALLKPAVAAHYAAELKGLRDGERGRNLRTAIEIRDDARLRQSAAGQKVRLAAAAQLDGDLDGSKGVNVNVGVRLETPGYVIKLTRRADREEGGGGPLIEAGALLEGVGGKSGASPHVHPHTMNVHPETSGPESFHTLPNIREARDGSD